MLVSVYTLAVYLMSSNLSSFNVIRSFIESMVRVSTWQTIDTYTARVLQFNWL